MTAHLLPQSNVTPFQTAVSLGTDSYARTDSGVAAMHGIKLVNPPPSWLPWLVYEYGLGELTPYVPNLYDLIEEGIDWQRVRGTPAAMELALGWLSYSATIEEFPTRRRKWNLFQLHLDRVRDDEADLPRIDGVARLSTPLRSYFWRGFHGYDVRAVEYSRSRWCGAMWGAYSGVRIGGQAKWSFGRRYDVDHVMTQPELEALGVWLPEVEGGPSPWWGFPWPAVPWVSDAAVARSVSMLGDVAPGSGSGAGSGTAWVAFKTEAGEVIGYRRARARHPVEVALSGPYRVSGTQFEVASAGAMTLYIEAMTDFGDAAGETAASIAVHLTGTPAEGHPPGALWLPAGGLADAGPAIAETPVEIPFGRTVRERVAVALRF